MDLPMLPPSLNNMYLHIRKDRKIIRVLAPEGRKFKNEATAYLAKHYAFELTQFKRNEPHALFIRLSTPDLYTKGWPEKAQNRYKKFDVSNRIKILEDVLSEIMDVDDSNFVIVGGEKAEAKGELTDIWIWNLANEKSPFHAAALQL